MSYPLLHLKPRKPPCILTGSYKHPRAFPSSSRYVISHITRWENQQRQMDKLQHCGIFWGNSFMDAELFLWCPRVIQTNSHWSISNTSLKQRATVWGNWPSWRVGDSIKVFKFSLMFSILFFISFSSSLVLSVRGKNTLSKIRCSSTPLIDKKFRLDQLKWPSSAYTRSYR